MSPNRRPQIVIEVQSLPGGDSENLDAYFTPLEHPENNHLWNVEKIVVTADPKNQVEEIVETNNVAERKVPFSSRLPIVTIDTQGVAIPDEPKMPR